MFAERSRIVNTIGLTGQSDAIVNSAAVAQERSSTISKQMKVTVFLQNIIEAACGVKTPNLERETTKWSYCCRVQQEVVGQEGNSWR